MRKLLISLIALVGLGATGLAFANGLGSGIIGSPHDFSDNKCGMYDTSLTSLASGFDATNGCGASVEYDGSDGVTDWNGRGEICRVCHVPHDHQLSTKYYETGLLWNRELSSENYIMYDQAWSSSIDGTVSAQPDGTAVLCLGCHDGTVALDTFDKYGGTAGRELGTGDYYDAGFKVGVVSGSDLDLTGTHPISVTYDDSVAARGLNDSGTTTIGTSGFIDDVLDADKVQCSSCHDVHDSPKAVAGTHLLRVQNGNADPSGLCLTCHDK